MWHSLHLEFWAAGSASSQSLSASFAWGLMVLMALSTVAGILYTESASRGKMPAKEGRYYLQASSF